jgi:hypothetical protein
MRWRLIPVFDHFLDARGRDDEKALSSWWKTHRHPFFLACPQARLVGLQASARVQTICRASHAPFPPRAAAGIFSPRTDPAHETIGERA